MVFFVWFDIHGKVYATSNTSSQVSTAWNFEQSITINNLFTCFHLTVRLVYFQTKYVPIIFFMKIYSIFISLALSILLGMSVRLVMSLLSVSCYTFHIQHTTHFRIYFFIYKAFISGKYSMNFFFKCAE